TVNVVDTVHPVALCQNVTVFLDASGNGSTTAEAVNDGSHDACSIKSLALSKTAFTCADIATNPNPVVLTVTDNNNNVATCNASVTVVDNTQPVINCPASTSKYVDPYKSYYTVNGQEFDANAMDACGIFTLTCTTSGATQNSVPQTSLNNVHLNTGSTSILWKSVDMNENTSTCTTVVTVDKRPTTLTNNGAFTIQYSDQVSLSATLKDMDGNLLSGKTITFSIGNQNVTATTGTNGVASATLVITQNPGNSYTVKSYFAGDDSYVTSQDEDPFTITNEDACFTYTGPEIVATNSALSQNFTILLSATIYEIEDGYQGSLSNTKARFLINNSPVSSWINVNVVNPQHAMGTVAYSWASSLSGNNTSDVFTVTLELQNYYSILSGCATSPITVTVYQNTGDFITGGGHISEATSAGLYPAQQGTNANFGFNVKFNKKGTNLQGKMTVVYRYLNSAGILRNYQIKSNSMTSLGVNPVASPCPFADFVSSANLQDVTNPEHPVSIEGNLNLHVTMHDCGEPGTGDKIGITLMNANGALYFSNNWSGQITEEQLLVGGNLVVHSSVTVQPSPKETPPEDKETSHISLKVYPNPFSSKVNFSFTANEDSHVRIDLYDMQGRLIKTICDQAVMNGVDYKIEYIPEVLRTEMIYYRMLIGNQVFTGKLLYFTY
ncbi:MAG: hypothetical protein Q8867_08785, partial [Bacteroidota bacterium]|nr:hypothetical protein [Bacteroidota bacterium]